MLLLEIFESKFAVEFFQISRGEKGGEEKEKEEEE